jgi:hypothetical protein
MSLPLTLARSSARATFSWHSHATGGPSFLSFLLHLMQLLFSDEKQKRDRFLIDDFNGCRLLKTEEMH